MKTRTIQISLLAAMIALTACVRRPRGVLSDKEMIPIVADMELAEASLRTMPVGSGDERRAALVEYVLRKHGVSREEFDSTMSWYGHNSDMYYEMCEKVDRELARRKKEVTGNRSVEVESSDLWPFSRQSLITRRSGTEGFEFSVPTTGVERGQRVNLKFRMNDATDAWALLGVEYDNGETAYLSRTLHSAKRLDMTLQTDTGRTVSRIFGNMVVRDAARLPLWLDSIHLGTLPYDTMEYYNIHAQRVWREPKARRQKPRSDETDSISSGLPHTDSPPAPGSATEPPVSIHPGRPGMGTIQNHRR